MDIQINDYYRVKSDEMNYIVVSRNDREPDEKNPELFTQWNNPKYFKNLENAFKFVMEDSSKRSEVTTIQELRELVLKVKADIDAALSFTNTPSWHIPQKA
jgi:hypothetical protein